MREGGWQHTIGPELAAAPSASPGSAASAAASPPIGQAFEMDVIAWSQNLQAEHAASPEWTAVGKDELFGAPTSSRSTSSSASAPAASSARANSG